MMNSYSYHSITDLEKSISESEPEPEPNISPRHHPHTQIREYICCKNAKYIFYILFILMLILFLIFITMVITTYSS